MSFFYSYSSKKKNGLFVLLLAIEFSSLQNSNLRYILDLKCRLYNNNLTREDGDFVENCYFSIRARKRRRVKKNEVN